MSKQSGFKIESNDVTIDQIFKEFYAVPDFQREYVWEHEHVERLLEDVFDAFYDEEARLIESSEYFLGSIVSCRGHEGIYQLIDGQQRMTTIYLVLCAARDALRKLGKSSDVLEGQISDVYLDPKTGEDIKRHRLTLQYEDSEGILEKLVKAEADEPVPIPPEATQSVKKILAAYGTIKEFLLVRLKNEPVEIKKFLVAFTKRIKLIRIITPTIANALKVFETINDRGVGLNAMDLLKNLLFMRTPSKDYPKLKNRWKILIDLLDRCDEKPLRFLRYYIMSHHEIDGSIHEDGIYKWFFDNAEDCGIDQDPLGFIDRLTECAEAYGKFLSCEDCQNSENRYLRNLSLLGGALRQQHILLLAGRHLAPDLFNSLCRAIENLFFCYIITREPTKTFERNFARWSGELRNCKDAAALDAFLDKYFVADLRGRTERFDFAFRELTQSDIQQYRMRYILAKLTQYIEEQAKGRPTHARLDHYTHKSVHIEHILPQTPTAEIREAFDKPDEYDDYLRRLGNLTLLEEAINSSVSNGGYIEKMPGYKQSEFLLTKSLAEKPHIGNNTQINRAVANLIEFECWDSQAITDRQEMLTVLARKVWDMPSGTREATE